MFIKKFFYNLSPPSHRDNNARYAVASCPCLCSALSCHSKFKKDVQIKKIFLYFHLLHFNFEKVEKMLYNEK